MANPMRSSARAKFGLRRRVSAPALSGASPRLYARAFDILAGRIADGALPAGARLLESHVAQEFGISRAPARQALSQLEEAGLVVRSDGHGYLVRGASEKSATRRLT